MRRILATLLSIFLSLMALWQSTGLPTDAPQLPSNLYTNANGIAGGTQPDSVGQWVTPNDAIIGNTTVSGGVPNGVGFHTVNLVLSARFQLPNGTISTVQNASASYTISSGAQQTPLPYIVPPAGGAWLIDAYFGISNSGTPYGQIFAQMFTGCGTNLSLVAGATGTITSAQFNSCSTATAISNLSAGNISSFQNLCYGNGINCAPSVPSNQGYNWTQVVSAPGAGVATVTISEDTTTRDCVMAITAILTTSNQVANRVGTVFSLGATSNLDTYFADNTAIPASTAVYLEFVAGQGTQNNLPIGTGVTTGLHTIPMGPSQGICFNIANGSASIALQIQGMQTNDTLTGITVRHITWSENN